MLLLKAEELELEGIAYEAGSQMVFHNTLFTKTQSFSQCAREAALDLCRKYLKADIVCLMVESQEDITLWRESQERNSDKKKIASATQRANRYQNPRWELKTPSNTSNLNQPCFKII